MATPRVATGTLATIAKNYYLGASIMVVAGLAEIVFGVEAARKSLEQVAQPLSIVADDVEHLGLNG
jgi:hypothetical protein